MSTFALEGTCSPQCRQIGACTLLCQTAPVRVETRPNSVYQMFSVCNFKPGFLTARFFSLLPSATFSSKGLLENRFRNESGSPFQNKKLLCKLNPIQLWLIFAACYSFLYPLLSAARWSLLTVRRFGEFSKARWGVVQPVGHLTVNEDGEGSNPSAPANSLFTPLFYFFTFGG